MSIRKQATETALDVINDVARTIADVEESRRQEPHYWANWHEVQLASLPKWRWFARLHHRRMARRYRSHIIAGRRAKR